jgi:tetratricopeptide (TPR) repeat protein
MDAVVEKAADGLSLAPQTKKGVSVGTAKNSLGKQVAALAAKGGSYHFLRARQIGGKTTILFRFLSAEGAANYHEYQLEPNGADYKATDVYLFGAGENFSETLRHLLIPVAAEQNRGLLEKLTGAESDYIKHSAKINTATEQLQRGQPELALKTLAALPPSLRQNKSIMLIRFRCAVSVGGKEYDDVMDDFAKFFPNDPAADLLLIDSFINKRQFDKAAKAIDSLEQRVGGDAWLKCLRANMLSESGKPEQAAVEYKKAIAEEPDMKTAYWAWVHNTLKQKDYRETVRLLNELEDKFGIQMRDLNDVPAYADFVKSDEYKTWLARPKTPRASKPEDKRAQSPKPADKK